MSCYFLLINYITYGKTSAISFFVRLSSFFADNLFTNFQYHKTIKNNNRFLIDFFHTFLSFETDFMSVSFLSISLPASNQDFNIFLIVEISSLLKASLQSLHSAYYLLRVKSSHCLILFLLVILSHFLQKYIHLPLQFYVELSQ